MSGDSYVREWREVCAPGTGGGLWVGLEAWKVHVLELSVPSAVL